MIALLETLAFILFHRAATSALITASAIRRISGVMRGNACLDLFSVSGLD